MSDLRNEAGLVFTTIGGPIELLQGEINPLPDQHMFVCLRSAIASWFRPGQETTVEEAETAAGIITELDIAELHSAQGSAEATPAGASIVVFRGAEAEFCTAAVAALAERYSELRGRYYAILFQGQASEPGDGKLQAWVTQAQRANDLLEYSTVTLPA